MKNLKNTFILALSFLFMVGSALFLSNQNRFEVGFVPDVFAVVDTSVIGSSCNDPTLKNYVPSAIDYVVTPANASRTHSPTSTDYDVGITLSDPVNGQSINLAGGAFIDGANTPTNFVTITHATPNMKLTGLECSVLSGKKLDVYGDGNDHADFDIAISVPGSADSTWTTGDKVDAATQGDPTEIFGYAGTSQVATAVLYDGSDADGSLNGSVASGGTNILTGGSEMHNIIKILSNEPNATDDKETITWGMTASN
jgi:hypothetical protein